MKNLFFILSILVFGTQIADSQNLQLSEYSEVSLLTNIPSDAAVYTVYGHTAIRIQDTANGIDYIFNYGIFDFDSPNFLFRFVKGETDYMVVGIDTDRYLYAYQMNGIGITQQKLNLNIDEKQKIWDALQTNCLPENRVYRYNYFYDNCSTRPRDIIEKNINGTIVYSKTDKNQTYRDLVHECVSFNPWMRFGIDLLIGGEADKEITDRQKDFLPVYLKKAYSGAKIKDSDSSNRNLVSEETWVVEPLVNGTKFVGQEMQSTPVDTPLIVGCILLLISIIVSYLSYKKNWILLGEIFDTLLFLVAGIAGCIILFLMLFSVHPCVGVNWNIVWLNPIQLIFAALFLIKFFAKSVYYYHFINFVALILFILAWFLTPQYLEVAFLPCILALATRSGIHVLTYKKKKLLNS